MGNGSVHGPMIEVARSPGKGKGVFALERIEAGRVIERSPITRYEGEAAESIRRTPVFLHTFVGRGEDERDQIIVAWGLVTMANHSEAPSASVHFEAGFVTLTAQRVILKGEEITIRYENADDYDFGE